MTTFRMLAYFGDDSIDSFIRSMVIARWKEIQTLLIGRMNESKQSSDESTSICSVSHISVLRPSWNFSELDIVTL